MRCRPLLGTFVEITADREQAIAAGFAAMERVHLLMSAHDPGSDLSRINRFGHARSVEVDGWTGAVLERALYWSRKSEGAFDVVRAGKAALERGALSRHPGQTAPIASDWTAVALEGHMVRLSSPACLDLGGIAKGFATDQAAEAMKSAGASFGLVNAGGDIVGFGLDCWPTQIVHPASRRPIIEIELCNQALATSGFLPADYGLSGEHLVGAEVGWISATVRAPQCIDADALAKIVLSASTLTFRCLATVGAEAFRVSADGTVTAMERQEVFT